MNGKDKKSKNINTRTNELIKNLLEIWEDSVTATHLFLSDYEIKKIKKYVPEAIKMYLI